jgi:predicted Zn-dependent peptidase
MYKLFTSYKVFLVLVHPNCKHGMYASFFMNAIHEHTFDSGLTLVTESIKEANIAAINWGVRSGVAYNEFDGDSAILAELVQRGVRGFTAKEHNDALDLLGIKRQVSCGVEFFRVSGIVLESHFTKGFPLLSSFLLNPTLPEGDIDACKNLALQSLQSLADNPSHLVGVALNNHHLQSPYNRSSYGNASDISSATISRLRDVYTNTFCPKESILTITGAIDHQQVVNLVGESIEGWQEVGEFNPNKGNTDRGIHWIEHDSSQVHIGIAFDAPNAPDTNAILETIAISVFGGATSGRLFTEVRQRRSLCYSVSAQFAPSRTRSLVRMRAGTTPERADETIRVCIEQLDLLRNGITEEEFSRTIHRLKSRTVMGGESTSARASALWGDKYSLGHARSLELRLKEIEEVSLDDVNNWLKNRLFGTLTLVYLGPNEIKLPSSMLSLDS